MTDVAVIDETSTDIVPGQVGFNSAQRAMLAQLGLSDAPDGDLMLFSHVCQKSGLDPFRREIYMIGRNTQVTRYEKVDPTDPESNQRKVTRWETVYTIQTGIQGFRKRAREIADGKGDKLGFNGPYWCGEDGQWTEVWPKTDAPIAAKYIVFRNGEPIPAVCHYSEYVQTINADGQKKPNNMWATMPRNQIAKCAEAQALQRAYPDELSGLLLEDAAYQTVDTDGTPVQQEPTKRPGGRGVGGLRDKAQQATVIEGEVGQDSSTGVDEAAEEDKSALSKTARAKWLKSMFASIGEANATERDEQLTVIKNILGHNQDLEHRDAMTDAELRAIVTTLGEWKKAGTLADKVADILDMATLAAESGAAK